MPAATVGNATAAKRRSAGSGTSCSVALRDHAERALRADEQLRELGPDRVARHADGLDQPAGGRRDPQRQQQVLDLAVARREDARAAGGDVAADRRPLDRRRVVRQHQPAGVELGLEPAPVDARLGGDRHRALVDLDDPVERRHVDHDPAADRQAAALGARAAAPRDDGDAVRVGDAGRPRRPPPRSAGARRRRAARSACPPRRRAAPASRCRRRTRRAARAPSTRPLPSAATSACSTFDSAAGGVVVIWALAVPRRSGWVLPNPS